MKENTMNKTELIAAISEQTELTKKQSEEALKAFVDVVADALKKGDKVQLVGFGTFEVSERAARTGRNPRTNETIEIAASRTPKFKAGKALKDLVKE
uniref:HU family DNA-binding protein n=1 Tax=Eubacterium cellulosolvens TaxID=29322 RepID=UPI0031015B00